MYVCMHVCMKVGREACMHVYMYIFAHPFLYICTCNSSKKAFMLDSHASTSDLISFRYAFDGQSRLSLVIDWCSMQFWETAITPQAHNQSFRNASLEERNRFCIVVLRLNLDRFSIQFDGKAFIMGSRVSRSEFIHFHSASYRRGLIVNSDASDSELI